jgi:hypothetical protein
MANNGTNALSEEVSVYPNPTNSLFTVQLPYIEEEATIVVTDVAGKTILSRIVRDSEGNKVSLNLGDVAKGMYFVEVSLGDEHFRTKLVVQ